MRLAIVIAALALLGCNPDGHEGESCWIICDQLQVEEGRCRVSPDSPDCDWHAKEPNRLLVCEGVWRFQVGCTVKEAS